MFQSTSTTPFSIKQRIARTRTWQTLRTVEHTYRLWIHGTTQTRTILVKTWTGPGNLLDI